MQRGMVGLGIKLNHAGLKDKINISSEKIVFPHTGHCFSEALRLKDETIYIFTIFIIVYRVKYHPFGHESYGALPDVFSSTRLINPWYSTTNSLTLFQPIK